MEANCCWEITRGFWWMVTGQPVSCTCKQHTCSCLRTPVCTMRIRTCLPVAVVARCMCQRYCASPCLLLLLTGSWARACCCLLPAAPDSCEPADVYANHVHKHRVLRTSRSWKHSADAFAPDLLHGVLLSLPSRLAGRPCITAICLPGIYLWID